ncbi:MAG: PhnD/SsuA/transferrin family substrate-binding protein [Xanthomonadaceae bacterium]|nr:PhnD/SsuA/transferrin family substrate-binding protein [Xanthomonadaceae bacterium]MDE2258259.1 PhnD/SsuA/transferrin family substrate-binding protein [Xanthomonadaceae bacterium]
MRGSCRSSPHRLAAALLAVLGAGGVQQTVWAADYTFRIEPAYPADRVAEIYAPLMTYLNKTTGQHFTLVPTRNYHFYWRDMQNNVKTDFAFDEAHMADYRIEKQHFEPLVHTAEPTSYTLVSNIDLGNKGLQGLVGHTIVTMGAPSLGYALLLEFYPNPILQPDIATTATSWRDATDRVFGGEADAAMIPTWLKDQYPNLTPVKTTHEYPGQCITASPDVPADLRDKVKQALLKLDTDADASKLLFDLGVTKFVPATAKEYSGDEQILKNFIGYK